MHSNRVRINRTVEICVEFYFLMVKYETLGG